jgi:hypothetical protein
VKRTADDRTAYLPPRAARARKLILRRRLGLGWVLAAAAFGVVILLAGGLLLARGGRPGPPFVRVAPLAALPAGAVTQAAGPAGQGVVVDRRGGGVRALLAPAGPCPVTGAGAGYARPCTGERWSPTGAPVEGGAAALRPLPTAFAHGDLYVNPR